MTCTSKWDGRQFQDKETGGWITLKLI